MLDISYHWEKVDKVMYGAGFTKVLDISYHWEKSLYDIFDVYQIRIPLIPPRDS